VVSAHRFTGIFGLNNEAWLSGKRRALNEGGTASSKTWSILQLLYMISLYTKSEIMISVVSESLPHLKKGAIRDFFRVTGEDIDSCPYYNKTDHIYKRGKGTVEFFGADESGKVRGPRRDILFINEGNNVPWETARGLDIRTRLFTFVDWNPVSEFWAHERWIGQPENTYIHSTYMDAVDVLPPEVVANIESNKNDPNWWNIYGLGRIGKIEGLVYPMFEQVGALPPGDVFYGMDFGYSNDPTVLVKCIIKGDGFYCEELIYEKGLTNDAIAYRMAELGVIRNYDEIYADSAEPKSIEEIYQHGFNIKPAPKGAGSVEYGHQKVRQYKQFWTADSTNCIKEQRNFRYVPDKDGKLTDKTTHQWSHCLIAGTLITTIKGQKPIEQVTVDDFVLTRSGWRKVKASGMVTPLADVCTVTFSDGVTITGTPSHKILTGNGFIPLHSLRYGDIIEVCEENSLFTMARNITDTQKQMAGQIPIITGEEKVVEKIAIFIAKYGLIITGQSRKVLKSITKIKTHLITILRILNACIVTCINLDTHFQSGELNGCNNTLTTLDHYQRTGIARLMESNGIGNMVERPIKTASHWIRSVCNVASHLRILPDSQQLAFAQTPVNQNGEGNQDKTTRQESALGARSNSPLTNTMTPKPVPVYVVNVSDVLPNKQAVYDLTIDKAPEFYANGVLVHNSMDARRYAIMGMAEPVEQETIIIYDAMQAVRGLEL